MKKYNIYNFLFWVQFITATICFSQGEEYRLFGMMFLLMTGQSSIQSRLKGMTSDDTE